MNLEQKAAEAAANAVCTRCGCLMVQIRGASLLITGLYRRVGGKGSEHFNLCSMCGPAFRQFLGGDL